VPPRRQQQEQRQQRRRDVALPLPPSLAASSSSSVADVPPLPLPVPQPPLTALETPRHVRAPDNEYRDDVTSTSGGLPAPGDSLATNEQQQLMAASSSLSTISRTINGSSGASQPPPQQPHPAGQRQLQQQRQHHRHRDDDTDFIDLLKIAIASKSAAENPEDSSFSSSKQKTKNETATSGASSTAGVMACRDDDGSIICRRCGRCRCAKCKPRLLLQQQPAQSASTLSNCCCSTSTVERLVDVCSCVCCVRELFYHFRHCNRRRRLAGRHSCHRPCQSDGDHDDGGDVSRQVDVEACVVAASDRPTTANEKEGMEEEQQESDGVVSDGDEDDDDVCDADDDPCGCGPARSSCCCRWTVLVALSACLPCLVCYWPLRWTFGALARCSEAAAAGRSRGCRCPPALPLPSGHGGLIEPLTTEKKNGVAPGRRTTNAT
jgi:hypothetical protein